MALSNKEQESPSQDGVRLQKALSAAGVASRRASEDLITKGRVKVNGKVPLVEMITDVPALEIVEITW